MPSHWSAAPVWLLCDYSCLCTPSVKILQPTRFILCSQRMENPYRGFAPVCICGLSIAPRFRNCKRRRGNFLHFGRLDKILRRNWAKWRKIRASSRPWPPLGGGCRRSRLGERNPYGVSPSVALRATPPSQREANGRGRAPPLHTLSPTGYFCQ